MITTDENGHPFAAVAHSPRPDIGDQAVERSARRFYGVESDLFGAVRVVEIKDRSLGKRIGRAVARGMKGISLNLCGATIGGSHDQGNRANRGGHGTCVIKELAGNCPFSALGKGDKMCLGATATGQGSPRECGCSTHEAHEIAARES